MMQKKHKPIKFLARPCIFLFVEFFCFFLSPTQLWVSLALYIIVPSILAEKEAAFIVFIFPRDVTVIYDNDIPCFFT